MITADLPPFAPFELPPRFCNLDRLIHAMAARGLDGVVITSPWNTYYLSGFNGIAHKSDEPRPYAVVLSRRDPEDPIAVAADYYLGTFLGGGSWIRDVRPFRAVMMPIDRPPQPSDIDRFIPDAHAGVDWLPAARGHYGYDMTSVLKKALGDLGLDRGTVAFDDMGLGFSLGLEDMAVADAYDPLMFARAVKTPTELTLLERATQLNEAAILQTVDAWEAGATWRDLDRVYARAVAGLGGFVRDPGGLVWGHPRGADPALTLRGGTDDGEIETGTHVMFDCHGTLDLYCWDGGKTWVVGGQPEGPAKAAADATRKVTETLLEAMRPGARISELQTAGRAAFAKAGMTDPDNAIVFFRGLGLSHMDLEVRLADGTPNRDWCLEEDMVVPLHLLYPGGANDRIWLEDVVHVTKDGGRPLFSWGFDPLTG